MKLVKIILFFILLFSPIVLVATVQEIIVTDADSVWSPDLTTASSDVIDSTDAPSGNLITEAFVSHADSVWSPELTPASSDVIDSTDAPTQNLIKWAFISHADSVWSTELKENGWKVKPDFWIERIRPVQVVWDSKIDDNDTIDLVAGKSTMVRVYVGKEDYETLPKNLPLDVRLTLTDYGFDFPKTESRTIEQLEQNNWKIDFYPISLEEPGNHVIRAEVDPKEIDEADETNNFKSLEVTVKNTNGLYLIHFPIKDNEGNTPDPTAYQETVQGGGEFILGTYPISSQEFRNKDGEEEVSAVGSLTNILGRILTLPKLWLAGKRATDWQSDVAVGIVSTGSLGEGEYGFASSLIGAVLVEEKYWTVTAHEIGHVYGLWVLEEEYDRYGFAGRPAEGFWVNKEFEVSNAFCFMSYWVSKEKTWNWWISRQFVDTWIDREDYENLFREFRVNPVDPEALLVSGLLSKDGSIQFAPWYSSPSGTIDEGETGDYSIRILGIDGEIINEISFNVRFQVYVTPTGIVETDIIPFGFSVPYPANTSRVEIRHNEQMLVEMDPRGKLLHDAIDLIPDYGFVKNPEERRNALHHKIDAVEKILDTNNFQGAIHKLEHDIKDKLEKWLVDNYQKENLLQYKKDEMIDFVYQNIERLSN